MRLFDTHGHLCDPRFDEDREATLQRVREAGVACAIVVADPTEEAPTPEAVFAFVAAHEGLYGVIGVHPHNASRYDAAMEAAVLSYLTHPKCVCLGEIGLDYHYDLSPRDVQRSVFDRQLDLAYERAVPVQLHIREAHGDCTDMLTARARAGRMPLAILHCYTGSWESAKTYLSMGMYISLSGAVTFANAPKLSEVAKNIPLSRLLIETDCPYMAPVPMRGRRNEPAYVRYTCETIARIRGVSPETIAEATFENACRAFRQPR